MNALFEWPQRTRVGARLAKERFTRGAPSGVRAALIDEVAAITWAYKLGEPALPLPPSTQVPEIAVIEVVAKGDDVSPAVIEAVDRAIPLPVLIEVIRPAVGTARMVGAPQVAGAVVAGPRFSSGWLDVRARRPLPLASSLDSLYLALLAPLLPAVPRPGEDVARLAGRVVRLATLERKAAAMESRVRAERQLNRQMDLYRTLKTIQSELETLR